MSKGITSIEVTPSWGQSPARTRRKTGEVFINEDYLPAGWKYLPMFILEKLLWKHPKWRLVLKHEEGHIALNTSSEDLADAYASKEYFDAGGSHRMSVKALLEFLPMNTPAHYTRVMNQVKRAALDDCKRNGHKKSCMLAETITGVTIGTVVARVVNTAIDKAVDHFSNYSGNYNNHNGNALNERGYSSVGIGEGVSVLDDFDYATGKPDTGSICGAQPKDNPCKKIVGRKKCQEANKARQDAWKDCIAEEKRAATAQKEEEGLTARTLADAEVQKALGAKTVEGQIASERASTEQTKTIIPIIAIALAVMLLMYFLFKSPSPKPAVA